MPNVTRQLILVGTTLTMLALALVIFLSFKAGRSKSQIMRNAVVAGLEQYFAELSRIKTETKTDAFSPKEQYFLLRTMPRVGYFRFLPSFVRPEDIAFPDHAVHVPSDESVCAIRLRRNQFIALSGRGVCEEVSKKQWQQMLRFTDNGSALQ